MLKFNAVFSADNDLHWAIASVVALSPAADGDPRGQNGKRSETARRIQGLLDQTSDLKKSVMRS